MGLEWEPLPDGIHTVQLVDENGRLFAVMSRELYEEARVVANAMAQLLRSFVELEAS